MKDRNIRNILYLLVGILICSLLPANLFAENPLSLDQVRSIALERSAELENSRLNLESEKLQYSMLKYELYPDVSARASASGSYNSSQPGGEPVSFSPSIGFTLNQQIFQGGTHTVRNKLASVNTNLAELEVVDTSTNIKNLADQYFYNYLESLAQEEAAEKAFQAAGSLLAASEARYSAGIISRVTFLQVKADTATKEAQLQQMKRNTLFAGSRLASLLGMETIPDLERPDLSDYASRIDMLSSLDEETVETISGRLISLGMESSTELRQAELNTHKARLNAELVKRQYIPNVSLSISENLSPGDDYSVASSGSVSLTGSVGLTPWDRNDSLKEAEISVRLTENNAHETARSLILEIRNAWYNLLTSARSVVSSDSALDYALELYDETGARYGLQAAAYTDLADAESLVATNRTNYIAAQFDFLIALSEITGILGLEKEDELWECITG